MLLPLSMKLCTHLRLESDHLVRLLGSAGLIEHVRVVWELGFAAGWTARLRMKESMRRLPVGAAEVTELSKLLPLQQIEERAKELR